MHVAVSAPVDLVHLVDHDDQVSDAAGLGEQSVLSGLAALLETTFELAFLGADHQSTKVGLTRALYHVRHVVLVSRGVDDRETLIFSLEKGFSDLDRLSLSPFFLALVHDVG